MRRLFTALLVAVCVVSVSAARAEQRPSPPRHAVPAGFVNGFLSHQVRQALAAYRGTHSARVVITSRRDIAGAVRALGGTVESDIKGRILTAQVPFNRIERLARLAGVIEVYPSGRERLKLDLAIPDIRADKAWALSAGNGLPVQGQHALVGIVDTGIDYHNPDFKDASGATRIKYIWDQTVGGDGPAPYTYGVECNAASIDRGACPEKDTEGHGTHVAGIAAGNGGSGSAREYSGVAPQADIIVVKTDLDDSHIIDAWQYLVDKAQQLHEPIAINNSFGSVDSPHDGGSTLSQVVDQLTGPGRVFVAAGGNEGGQASHTDGTFTQGQKTNIDFYSAGYAGLGGFPPIMDFGLFYDVGDNLTFTLTDLNSGESFGPVSQTGSLGQTNQAGDLQMVMHFARYNDRYREAYVAAVSPFGQLVHGHFRLTVESNQVSGTGHFDAWMLEEAYGQFANYDEADTVDSPADAQNMIAVTNYATRPSWTAKDGAGHNVCEIAPCSGTAQRVGDIAGFSSVGPTANGRQKPEIAAPGTVIVSALSGDIHLCKGTAQDPLDCMLPEFVTADNHLALTGSSMSAPMVTGTAALMLQVKPSLDTAGVRSVLESTARHDGFTGNAAWSPTWGAGKLDALAAVQAVLPPAPPSPPTATATVIPTSTPVPPTSTPVPEATPVPTAGSKSGTACGKGAHLSHGVCVCKKGFHLVHGKCKKKKVSGSLRRRS